MLDICYKFFSDLNERDIRYCHWKSNSHLDAALEGGTDLDVLVHTDDRTVFEQQMAVADFKQILSPPEKQFPGFEDFLGFDHATGKFVHLHVHYCLIMGRKYIKNHLLPIEQLYFDNLVLKYGVKIPCPELELIMLIMRAHMKVDYVSLLKHAIKDLSRAHYTAFPADIENEFNELTDSTDMEEFARLLEATGLPIDLEWTRTFLDRISNNELKSYHIWIGHYRVRLNLRKYRRKTGLAVQMGYLRQFLLNTRAVGAFVPYRKKTLPGAGRVFSIIGADGSGKSTLISDIRNWLSWKLTTKQYYYGIPKDLVREVSTIMMLVFAKLKLRRLERLITNLFWLHVARVRRNVSKRTERDVAVGVTVITDRYPLQDFQPMAAPMDNPRIDSSVTLFGKNLRGLEDSYYANLRFPDLALVLQVDIEELRRRKSDLPRDTHELKADAVNSIRPREYLVTIDANKPYEDVLLEVKRTIWNVI